MTNSYLPSKQYFRLYDENIEILATDKSITCLTFRVFLLAISHLDFDNTITISQSEISQILGSNRASVCRAFLTLVNKGIFIEQNRIGMTKIYSLNLEIGSKGNINRLNRKVKTKDLLKARKLFHKEFSQS